MTHISFNRENARSVAPDLYGLFFEDINRAGDSGLYPEMLRNRSFEDSIPPAETVLSEDASFFTTKNGHREVFFHGEGDRRWAERHPYTPIPGWYAENAVMELDRQDTLNPKREAALRVHFSTGGSIYNIGYCGIAAQKDVPLCFYAFWKGKNNSALTLRLIGKDNRILVEASLPVSDGEYARVDARLLPVADDPEARLFLTSESEAEIWIGFTSLMPEKTYRGHGLREDLVELLKKTHSKFMRYPGGCIVEGLNKTTALRFTEIIGPVWERPSLWDLWHYRSTYGFGFHEFLQLCEDLDMEALYVVNCGMSCQARCPEFFNDEELAEMIDQTRWAIEYATGDVSTKWGAYRAKMGHPEKFRLKYIEIGNENDGPEYDKRYQAIYEILHREHPEIILISDAHTEQRGLPTDYIDEHYYFDWQFFAQSETMYDPYPKDGPKIFLGEYAITRGEDVGTLHAALSETRFLMACEDHPEVVHLASYAPLFENIHYKQWNPNLIFFDNHRSAALPTLHALGMLGESRGKTLLTVQNDAEKLRPVKYGFNGFIAYDSGLRMMTPEVNGQKAALCKQVLGQWQHEGDAWISDITPYPGCRIESVTRYPIQTHLVNSIFTSQKTTRTEYTTRVYMDENTPKFAMTIWAHNSREPGILNLDPDPNAKEGEKQPNPWFGLGDVEYYTWTVENNQGQNCFLYRYTEKPLNEKMALPIRMGEYNEFRIVSGEGCYDCYLNGQLMVHAEDRSYRRVDTIVTEDDAYLYVKLLNNTDRDEEVTLQSDIAWQDAFEWTVLSGAPTDQNTLEEPEKVHAVKGTGNGAKQNLKWLSKAWSFTVLKFTKK